MSAPGFRVHDLGRFEARLLSNSRLPDKDYLRTAVRAADPAGRRSYSICLTTWPSLCGSGGASPPIPVPVGYPDCGRTRASVSFSPLATGLGETDWMLAALQNAAASSAGPGTWLLVGMALWGTGCRTFLFRIWRRSIALASRAVSGCSPKVDSIIFSVEVCSNGPECATLAAARLDTTMAGTRNPSWV